MKRVIFTVLVALLLVGCGSSHISSPAEIYTRVSEAKLKAGMVIPLPSEKAILKVTGKIGTENEAGAILMDLKTIEAVGLVEYKVLDPFKKKTILFRGVLMSDLLDLWQVKGDAIILQVMALNDYAVDVPIADLRKYPVLFALQADGEYMPIEDRGPAMFVYPYNNFTFDHTIYEPFWIWQIATIEVQ